MNEEKKVNQQEGKQAPVSLATMLGTGEFFTPSNGKDYKIKPLKIKEVQEFSEDQLSLGPQFINIANPKLKPKLEKWVNRQISDRDGNPVTLKQLEEEEWDVRELRTALLKMADLSG